MTGLHGNSGAMSVSGLLDLALKLSCSGTLLARYPSGVRLHLLQNGRLKESFEVGTPGGMEESEVDFLFEAHDAGDLPQLPSQYPDSGLAPLRALPSFGPTQALPAGLVDLRSLVSKVRDERLSGALVVEHEGERGLALFHEGRVGAAFFERAGHVSERSDALRALYRYSLEASNPPMNLHPLDSEVARSLLGLALERRTGSIDPNSFNGIGAVEGGFTYYRSGKPFLHLRVAQLSSGARFSPPDEIPDLVLPDHPPGWEGRRFDLTLRGRDALNPMTELSMEFSESYGQSGRKVLEAVRRGLSIEDTAAGLELDLQALKPWLERLETDGMIRLRR